MLVFVEMAVGEAEGEGLDRFRSTSQCQKSADSEKWYVWTQLYDCRSIRLYNRHLINFKFPGEDSRICFKRKVKQG